MTAKHPDNERLLAETARILGEQPQITSRAMGELLGVNHNTAYRLMKETAPATRKWPRRITPPTTYPVKEAVRVVRVLLREHPRARRADGVAAITAAGLPAPTPWQMRGIWPRARQLEARSFLDRIDPLHDWRLATPAEIAAAFGTDVKMVEILIHRGDLVAEKTETDYAGDAQKYLIDPSRLRVQRRAYRTPVDQDNPQAVPLPRRKRPAARGPERDLAAGGDRGLQVRFRRQPPGPPCRVRDLRGSDPLGRCERRVRNKAGCDQVREVKEAEICRHHGH